MKILSPWGAVMYLEFEFHSRKNTCRLSSRSDILRKVTHLTRFLQEKTDHSQKFIYFCKIKPKGLHQTSNTLQASIMKKKSSKGLKVLCSVIAIILLAGIRSRINEKDLPAPLRGAPIVMIAAALMSIAFMGFGGLPH